MDTMFVIFDEVSHTLGHLKMFPYFDACNYILMSMLVREDIPQSGNTHFSRVHPFSCWLSTMLMCFSSTILVNFFTGHGPLIQPFLNDHHLILASTCWYAINFSPFDILYKLCHFLPIRAFICLMKEILRARKIVQGVHIGQQHFPGSVFAWVLIGIIKGAGYTEMKLIQRLVRGVWLPASNEFLKPSFTSKASAASALAIALCLLDVIPVKENLVFLAVVVFLVYFRLSTLFFGLIDPFVFAENIVATVFFGGIIDALRSSLFPATGTAHEHGTGGNSGGGSAGSSSGDPSLMMMSGGGGGGGGGNTNATTLIGGGLSKNSAAPNSAASDKHKGANEFFNSNSDNSNSYHESSFAKDDKKRD